MTDQADWFSAGTHRNVLRGYRRLWGGNGVLGEIVMFPQRQHAMLAQPAENGHKSPFA
jgi:hypothetical protein